MNLKRFIAFILFYYLHNYFKYMSIKLFTQSLVIIFLGGTPSDRVLMGRVSITFSYSSRCLTTETVKYINENCFIENLAASKYSKWAQRGEKNYIKQYRRFTLYMFRRSELPCRAEM